MEDSMRSFFTGWNSGDALAQSDNSRYTQYGNTALNNTGAQNREMLGHINTLQKYYMTKRGPDGQPLDQESMDMLGAFINAKQVPFSQAVMVPGDRDVPAGMPPLTPILPTPPTVTIPPVYPNGTGPYPPPNTYPNGTGPYPPAQPPPTPNTYPNGTFPAALPTPPPQIQAMPPIAQAQPQPRPQPQPQPKRKKKPSAFPGDPPELKRGPRGGMTNFPYTDAEVKKPSYSIPIY